MDLQLQLQLQTTNLNLFDEFEYDDDVFYIELRKQVLQLTEEDDDDDTVKNSDMVQAQKQGPKNAEDAGYYNWPANKENRAAPAWMTNLWRTGNGTGVFIPQTVQSRRRSRSRRKKNGKGRTCKSVETMA